MNQKQCKQLADVSIGKAIKDKRDQYVLATKFGLVPHADGKGADVNGTPEHVRSACEASLKRLQTDHIDLYYQHRVDRKVGIETTVKEMKVSCAPKPPVTVQHTCRLVYMYLHTLSTSGGGSEDGGGGGGGFSGEQRGPALRGGGGGGGGGHGFPGYYCGLPCWQGLEVLWQGQGNDHGSIAGHGSSLVTLCCRHS